MYFNIDWSVDSPCTVCSTNRYSEYPQLYIMELSSHTIPFFPFLDTTNKATDNVSFAGIIEVNERSSSETLSEVYSLLHSCREVAITLLFDDSTTLLNEVSRYVI